MRLRRPRPEAPIFLSPGRANSLALKHAPGPLRGRSGLQAGALRTILVLLIFCGCSTPEPEIPTWTIEPTAFEHRITAEGELKAAVSTPVTVPAQVRSRVRLAWLAEDGSRVEEGDVVARFDPQEMEDRLRGGQADLRAAKLRERKADLQNQARLTDLEADFDIAELELDHAQRFRKTDAGIFTRHEIIEEQIDEELAVRRKENAAGAQETQQALGKAELEIQQIEKRKAQIQIEQAEAGLDALEVRAPNSGVLTISQMWNGPIQVGTDLFRGQEIGQIPDLDKLEAEVYVLEADAGGLAEGQKATVIVEAHPEVVHEATITHVDAAAAPRFRGSPVQYFSVVLELSSSSAVEGLKPGQRVRASLELANHDDAIVVPRQAIFREGGEPHVFRETANGFETATVEIGAAGRGLVMIEDGLQAGDRVALRRPPSDASVEDSPPNEVAAQAARNEQEAEDGNS